MVIPSREELALAVDEAEWGWLKAHLEREGLIIVALSLDIVEVGLALTIDDTAAIREWVEAKQLTKPSLEQITTWDRQRDKRFLSLIVTPFVLIQEGSAKIPHC